MNVTLKQLLTFITIAECGSFTEAAHKLCLTQAALSLRVRELEDELKAKIFDREQRTVCMTEVGLELYPYAKRVFNELSIGMNNVASLREKENGRLRVAAAHLIACTMLPGLIGQYRLLYPGVEISVQDGLTATLLQRLNVRDVEVVIGPVIDTDIEVKQIPLVNDRQWLVCPRDHPLSSLDAVSWAQVAEWPLISPTKDFTTYFRKFLLESGNQLSIEPSYEVSFTTTALGMVAAGMGVSVVPTFATALVQLWNLNIKELVEPAFHRPLCIYVLPNRSLSPAAESFVEVVRGHHA